MWFYFGRPYFGCSRANDRDWFIAVDYLQLVEISLILSISITLISSTLTCIQDIQLTSFRVSTNNNHKTDKKYSNKNKSMFITFRNWQIPVLDSWNMILCVSFLIGFSKSLVSFSHIFITGGSGKNGSTVAVSQLLFLLFFFRILFQMTFLFV